MAQPAIPGSPPPAAPTVAIGSPEFQAIIDAAVARAMARVPVVEAAPAQTIGLPQPVVIQATSIDTTKPGLDDLTVRFTRFCTFQGCGYQRGQEAGFPRKAAEALQVSGSAFIVSDPRHAKRAA